MYRQAEENKNFKLIQKNNLWFGTFPHLTDAGFINACSCRLHGESAIKEGMLNLALHVGDDADAVVRNRRAFAAAIGVDAKRFTTCQQVHGNQVVVVDKRLVGSGASDFANTIAGTDALVTNLQRVPLLLFFADCVPILLADTRTGAIGLAHGGWRGTVAGIATQTVQAMVDCFGTNPGDILAAIGPSIGQCCYEVDDFVRNKAAGYEKFFAPVHGKPGKYMLNLQGYNMRLLEEAGVPGKNILDAAVCTAHNAQLFCSYRAEAGNTGRMGVCLCRK